MDILYELLMVSEIMASKRSKNASRDSIKRARNVMTLEEKIIVLDRLARGESAASVGRRFTVNESTIRTIKKNEATIRTSVALGTSISSKVTCMPRNRNLEKTEKALIIWIEDQSQKNISLTTSIICDKAKRIYNHFVKESENRESLDGKDKPFQASKGWYEKFKKRFNLHNINLMGESASTDHDGAVMFTDQLKKVIEERGYLPQQVFNADETGLFWKCMPSKTFFSKGEKAAPGFKAPKHRLTLLLCSNASGDCFIKPMLVHRSLNPHCLTGKNKEHLPVFWRANQKARVTASLFTDWFDNCFVPEVMQYFERKNLLFRALLIIDNASCHPETVLSTHRNIEVLFLPPATSLLIQPMNQGIIATLKSYYMRRMLTHVLNSMNSEPTLTVFGCWKKFNIANAIDIIKDSIDEIKPSILNACWKKIWQDAVKDSSDLPVAVEIHCIVDIARRLVGDEFSYMQLNDIEELLQADIEELSGDLENMITASSSEDDDEEIQEESSLNLKNLNDGLVMAQNLADHFTAVDPTTKRSLHFKRGLEELLKPYNELQEQLTNQLAQP